MSEPRVFLGVTSGSSIVARTTFRLMGLVSQRRLSGFSNGQSNVSNSHNLIVQRALDNRADYVWFIDCDMDFSPDMLDKLLACDKDVVAVPYLMRSEPHVLMAWPEEGEDFVFYKGMRKARRMPSGMMLIKAHVLQGMGYPWFFETYGSSLAEWCGTDIKFCDKARECGFEVWCNYDLALEIAHIADGIQLRPDAASQVDA